MRYVSSFLGQIAEWQEWSVTTVLPIEPFGLNLWEGDFLLANLRRTGRDARDEKKMVLD